MEKQTIIQQSNLEQAIIEAAILKEGKSCFDCENFENRFNEEKILTEYCWEKKLFLNSDYAKAIGKNDPKNRIFYCKYFDTE